MSRYFFLVPLAFTMMAATTGCNLSDLKSDNELAGLEYRNDEFIKTPDYLEGSGEILYKTALRSETAMARIQIRAKFLKADSSLTIYSHMKTDFTRGYELKFLRLGDTVRLVTSLHADNPRSVGIVFDGVENWSSPLDFDVTIDNSQARPSISVKSYGRQAGAANLTETREEGFPEGKRVGIHAQDMAIYAFIVSDD